MGLLPFGNAPLPIPVPIKFGGTGSATQNFVDLSSNQTKAGTMTFTGTTQVGDATHNGNLVIYDSTNSESGTITRSHRTGTGEGAFFMDELQLTGGRFSFDTTNGSKAEIDVNGSSPLLRFYNTGGAGAMLDIQAGGSSVTSTTLYSHTLPATNGSYNLGSTSLYWSNLYATTLNLNSTASISGSTAGQISLNGGPVTGNANVFTIGASSFTDPSNSSRAINLAYQYAPTATATGRLWGLQFNISSSGANNFTDGSGGITGIEGFSSHGGTATMSSMNGALIYARNQSTGTVTNLYGIRMYGLQNNSTGTVTSGFGIHIASASNGGGGTFTNNYALYISGQTVATTNYAIYTNAGLVHFGDKTLLAASTTSAASLNIPSGVAPTSPSSGDMWFDGTHLYIRIGSTTTTIV